MVRLHSRCRADAAAIPGLSRFTQCVLHQGRIERAFLDAISFDIERGVMPIKLEIDESQVEDEQAYPITVTLQHLTEEEAQPAQFGPHASGLHRSNMCVDLLPGSADLCSLADDEVDAKPRASANAGNTEVVRARYVVGCDGARSWVRNQLGYALEGEPANIYWGALSLHGVGR